MHRAITTLYALFIIEHAIILIATSIPITIAVYTAIKQYNAPETNQTQQQRGNIRVLTNKQFDNPCKL